MLLINTRPADRAAALTHALQKQGIAVIALPLLTLSACPLSAKLMAQFQALSSAQVIVVVSPMAVQVGMDYMQQMGLSVQALQHIAWIAVGQTTADALAKYGIKSVIPQVETSEGMLELPVLKQLTTASKIAFWRGEGGRQFMMQQLADAGHQIENMLLYERAYPESSTEIFQQHVPILRQSKQTVVLVSSEASWLNWLNLTASQPNLSIAEYWVLGERLEQILIKSVKNSKIKVLSSLKVEDVLAAVQHQGRL